MSATDQAAVRLTGTVTRPTTTGRHHGVQDRRTRARRARVQHLVAVALVAALLAVPSSASAATYKIKAFSDDTFGPKVLTVFQGNLVK